MRLKIGIPARPSSSRPRPKRGGKPTVREYAFVDVRSLIPAYKAMLAPMLHDQKLGEESELGILMIDAPVVGSRNAGVLLPWTVFVKPIWLRWVVQGHGAGFGLQSEVPPDQIYGQIPVWPDEFFEFLGAIVESGKKFEWQRSPKGYLALQQSQSHA
ncbi:hypothetical protein B5K05_28075 [Rhizobium phaseoli]|nr:hypothetical protein B5K05_28075 [Rhizobium phaseoli]